MYVVYSSVILTYTLICTHEFEVALWGFKYKVVYLSVLL